MRKLLAALALVLTGCTAGAVEDNGAGARQYVVSLGTDSIVCSGVTLRPGLILTASHCVGGELRLTPTGTVGTVVANGDQTFDLALVMFPEAEAPCPCVPVAETEAAVDERVITVGYPRGITQVVTFGTSQGVVSNSALPYGGPRLVATSPVMGGNSGGGVFVYRDGEYQLVGILVEGLQHIALAMPIQSIDAFLTPNL